MGSVARVLATIAGLGDRLPAAGTLLGSPVGVGLFLLATRMIPQAPAAVALLGGAVLVPLAIWACHVEAHRRGVEDPGAIVLDEVVGQWLVLSVLVLVRRRPPRPIDVAVAFVLFRLFDIVKPWPLRALERLPGGWGIVADDLGAGLMAAAALLLLQTALPAIQ